MKIVVFLLFVNYSVEVYLAYHNGEPITGWLAAALLSFALFLEY